MPEPLTAAGILAAAHAILDREGPAGLSMRAIAARLDVRAASLYHHIRNKDALLQAVVDGVAVEVADQVDPALPWRPLLATFADRMRGTLRRHPGATAVVATRHVSPETAQRLAARYGEPLAARLGTGQEEALLTLQSLAVLVIGLALAEFGDAPNEPAAPATFYDAWFDLAVGTFLDGVAARLAATPPTDPEARN